MTRQTMFLISIASILCSGVALAQVASARPGAGTVFVYVSSSPNSGEYQINAFSAAPDGELTPVPDSPFAADVQPLAAAGKYLFGSNGVYIYSYSLAADGAPTLVSSVNAQQYNDGDCGGPVALFFDRTGSTIYDADFYGNICANSTYQFFQLDSESGSLSYFGVSDPSVVFDLPLTFMGNNTYAYSSGCYHMDARIFGFRRDSDGTLTDLNIQPQTPAPRSGNFYCTYLAAADLQNHVAISVQAYDSNTWQPVGSPQLATYTADDAGNLSTASTYRNMPSTAVKNVLDLQMSPSGRLLAVAGSGGLQLFRFNGSDPVTPLTGLLTRTQVDQVGWDQANRLYAISQSAGKLFVFTTTPASLNLFEAPGSPYPISNPQNIAVLSK